jgi:hypothetical protein
MMPFYASHGIVKCPNCGLVFYAGAAVPKDVYTSEYFTGGEYADYVAAKPITQYNFRRRIAELARLVPAGDLLEIGSAYGFFLELARQQWTARGVEIAAEGVHTRGTSSGSMSTTATSSTRPKSPTATTSFACGIPSSTSCTPSGVWRKSGAASSREDM